MSKDFLNSYLNHVLHGDCLEVLKQLPDKSIDLCFTDPPYGIKEAKGKNKSRGNLAVAKDYGNLDWDDQRIDNPYIQEILRVSQHQIIFGGNYYADLLPPSPCWIVWDKDNNTNDFADAELIYTSLTKATRIIKHRWNGMLQQNMTRIGKESRFHPTQKPVELCIAILTKYSEWVALTPNKQTEVHPSMPMPIILDPFCGSGSLLVASKIMGFDIVGVDQHLAYVDITKERLRQNYLF